MGGMRVGNMKDYSRHRFPKVAKQHLRCLRGGVESALLYYNITILTIWMRSKVKNGETKFCGIWVCMWEGNEAKVCELVFYGPDLSSGFAILMPSIGLKALPLKECISLRIHFFSLNIENIMFPYHMVPIVIK